MKLHQRVRPISHFKANAAAVIDEIAARREPMIITRNGQAAAIIQDVKSYEETQNTLAFLKALAIGDRAVARGDHVPAEAVFARLRGKHGL
ncbi:MAG: type II toxin-antitoxin system Phd/YefM family antitoxin [Rhodospirillaceae bacterium]|nr:type II toxin-antitoxin system Phd/YefM family antitoxin [Rhodospirillaceae bacterium]